MTPEYEEYPERHFWLYAKGWYKKRDCMSDLKKIVASIALIPEDSVSRGDVQYWLSHCIFMN
jgi:hypothetical protein